MYKDIGQTDTVYKIIELCRQTRNREILRVGCYIILDSDSTPLNMTEILNIYFRHAGFSIQHVIANYIMYHMKYIISYFLDNT